jgi:hypothetical protein
MRFFDLQRQKCKKFCKALVGTFIRFLNLSKWTKTEKDMRLKLERGLELFFSKKIDVNYHTSSSCVFCVVPLLLTLK